MTVQTASPPVSPFVTPWRATPRTTMITTVVIAVIVLISATTVVVQRFWFTPESVVNGYFTALANRDAKQALTYGGSTVSSDLLSSDKYVPPTKLAVDDLKDDDKDGKTAKVSFLIGDKRQSGTVRLHHKSDLSWGLFRGWELAGDRPSIEVTTTAPVAVQVNGHALNPETDGSHLDVFPGRYVVDLADNPLVESDPVTIDAAFGNSTAELTPRIKTTAKTAVDKQINAYLTGCLTAATKPDSNCPFSINSDITRPVWRITTFPTVALRIADDGTVVAESTTQGKATLTGTGYGGYPVNDDTSFTVGGPVTVEQGAIKFTPQS
jgi:hypothetical protein